MIRAGVDDPDMARVVGIRVSQLFTIVFALGAGLAGFAGIIGGPILSVYPGIDQDMLPLALVVVILGGTGSLLGSFVGSIIVGFIYNFGQALLPELAYFVLFLPMLLVLIFRPQGLFGRARAMSVASGRIVALAVAFVALVTVPYWMPRHLLHQRVEPDPVLRHLRARPEHLVGYAGLVSLGHAGLFGITAYAIAYLHAERLGPSGGDHFGAADQPDRNRSLRGAGAARHRHRFHHDHAGARPDHLGPGLPLDQPDRRRQRHQRAHPAGAVRL